MRSSLSKFAGVFLAGCCVLCSCTACAADVHTLTLEQLESLAKQPARVHEETGSLLVPEMLQLFREESITYTGKDKYKDTVLKFRLHVPEKMEPGHKYPLILWLHGVGEAGDDNQAQLIHLHHVITYMVGPKKRDFFLLVPQTPDDHTGWDAYSYTTYQPKSTLKTVLGKLRSSISPNENEAEEEMVAVEEGEAFEDSPLGFSFAMLDYVKEKYPVDENRITVSGLSSGGDGTWRALERRPEEFAAAVPLVSWNPLTDTAISKHPILKKVPIWAIYSSDDNGIDFAREEFARVEKAGCNVKKSEFGLCGHNAWTPAMLQADIFSWLLSRAKKDESYFAVLDPNVDPEDMQGIVEVAGRDTRVPTLAQKPDPPSLPGHTNALVGVSTLVPEPPPGVLVEFVDRPQNVNVAQNPTTHGPAAFSFELSPSAVPVFPTNPPSPKDDLYARIAYQYISVYDDPEGFERVFRKLSPPMKWKLLNKLLGDEEVNLRSRSEMQLFERLMDEIPASPLTPVFQSNPPQPIPFGMVVPRVLIQEEEEHFSSPVEAQSGVKIVEECDKPWAMSSGSLYGLFPADWNREAKIVPEFVISSTAEQLRSILLESLEKGDARLDAICKSVLGLDNQPLGSPWFKTSGGRFQSDIAYTLSEKGEVLVETLENAPGKTPQIRETLEKIQRIVQGD